MLTAILFMSGFAIVVAIPLAWVSARWASNADDAIESINNLLPQIQCGQCGYAGCRPYAVALHENSAELNQCPPGGESTLKALSLLLDRPVTKIDRTLGPPAGIGIASIDEAACIGCALCLQACPVDAILGAPSQMHTVIVDECTGCELCLAPCPVDCISILNAGDFPVTPTRTKRI